MLTKAQYDEIRKELDESANPLFFYHDDPDGLASFLLLSRYCKEGDGVPVKSTPQVTAAYLNKVREYEPDKIFIVDLAIVDQDFIDGAKVPVIWIDHHEPLTRHGVKYFNPRLANPSDNIPASCLCYGAVQQDLWIAAVGAVGDWYLPSFAEQFSKEHPKLLPPGISTPDEAMFNAPLGELVMVFSFILKGQISDVKKNVKLLAKIQSPEEILDQESEGGQKLYQRYLKVKEEYERLLARAEKSASDDRFLVFTYEHESVSFTKDIANSLLYKFPGKIMIIGRIKDGEYRLSLRSRKVPILPVLKEALKGVKGYGGGHEFACGANVSALDFERFLNAFKVALN